MIDPQALFDNPFFLCSLSASESCRISGTTTSSQITPLIPELPHQTINFEDPTQLDTATFLIRHSALQTIHRCEIAEFNFLLDSFVEQLTASLELNQPSPTAESLSMPPPPSQAPMDTSLGAPPVTRKRGRPSGSTNTANSASGMAMTTRSGRVIGSDSLDTASAAASAVPTLFPSGSGSSRRKSGKTAAASAAVTTGAIGDPEDPDYTDDFAQADGDESDEDTLSQDSFPGGTTKRQRLTSSSVTAQSHSTAGGGGGSGGGKKEKKKRNLSKSATDALNLWFFNHLHDPYPTDEDKQVLAQQCGLTMNQVNNWFGNKRMRYKRKMLDQARRANQAEDFMPDFSSDGMPNFGGANFGPGGDQWSM